MKIRYFSILLFAMLTLSNRVWSVKEIPQHNIDPNGAKGWIVPDDNTPAIITTDDPHFVVNLNVP